ncbi:MAG TPA: polysaccharide deacetylase family protein, partial [Actinomycetota bacterium]
AQELAEGHMIGNHTFDHPDLGLLASYQVDAEIERGADAIREAGAPRPTLFRPPRGVTDEVVGVLADAERYRTIFWELTVEHYVDHMRIGEAVERLLDRVAAGTIILAHDGGLPNRIDSHGQDRSRTIEALPALLEGTGSKAEPRRRGRSWSALGVSREVGDAARDRRVLVHQQGGAHAVIPIGNGQRDL